MRAEIPFTASTGTGFRIPCFLTGGCLWRLDACMRFLLVPFIKGRLQRWDNAGFQGYWEYIRRPLYWLCENSRHGATSQSPAVGIVDEPTTCIRTCSARNSGPALTRLSAAQANRAVLPAGGEPEW